MALKSKILNFLLLVFSLLGYLEWGIDQKEFLFQLEVEILLKFVTDPISVIHPFTILPFVGQLALLFTLFQEKPSKRLTFIGMAGLGILLVLMFVIGLISLNYKITLSTIPFLTVAFLTIRHHRKKVTM